MTNQARQTNAYLAGLFGNIQPSQEQEQQKLASAQQAAQILEAIRSGQIDPMSLPQEEADKLASIVMSAVDPTEQELMAAEQQDPGFFERYKLAGAIAAHAHWAELMNLNAHAEKVAHQNTQKQRAEILKQASAENLVTAIESGELSISDLSNDEAAYVLRKIANPAMESTHANPEAMRAMLGMPAAAGAPAPDWRSPRGTVHEPSVGGTNVFAQVVEEAAPEAHPEQKASWVAKLKQMGEDGLNLVKQYGGQALNFIDQQAMRAGAAMGASTPGMQRAGGYGAGAAGLGLLGAGAYGLSQMGKESSAQPRTQLEAAFLQHMSKQAAAQQQPQQQQLSALDEEAIKVAQVMLLQHGYAQEGVDAQAVQRRAIELLQQNGWEVK